MFIYCIVPGGDLKCNFIKIGTCIDSNSLYKRYNTYYGSDLNIHYVSVKNKNVEKCIHNKLKTLGLHLKNELFIYNEIYNFDYYVNILDEYKNDHLDHIFEFFAYICNKKMNNITYIMEKYKEKWKYFEKIESFIYYNKHEFKKIWMHYLMFCDTQLIQVFNRKNELKHYIINMNKTIFINKPYIFEITENFIKIVLKNKINFKEYISKKYNVIINIRKKSTFEKILDNSNMSNEEIIKFISSCNNNDETNDNYIFNNHLNLFDFLKI